jgi:streptogrisin C
VSTVILVHAVAINDSCTHSTRSITMNNKHLYVAIMAVIACGFSRMSIASELPDQIDLQLSPESVLALEQDANRYAQAAGITPVQARGRFMAQMGSAELISKLRETNRNRLAGIYTEHDNGHKIIVRLKGGGNHVREKIVRVGDEIVTVVFRPGAPYTLEEVKTVLAESMPVLQAELPTMQGGFANEKATEIVIDVLAQDATRIARVADMLGDIPIRLNVLSGPIVQHAMGGGHLDSGNCTTGFTVKRTGTTTTGITTAGHCPNVNSSYTGADGSATTTFQAESWGASTDYQWHTASNTNQAKFTYQKSGTTWSTRTLTGRRLQSSTSAGNNICHYGATSNYSCGDVLSTSYQPVYSGACNGATTCTATYITVGPPSSGTGLACAGGDSGGPWFVSTVAVGVHKGGASSGSSIGQCSLAIFMSTDRISGLGLELVFGP